MPYLCVNVLSAEQHELSDAFARSGRTSSPGSPGRRPRTGHPLCDGAAAHIEARIAAHHDGGDHHIVTCIVEALSAEPDPDPLLYYRSSYRALDHSNHSGRQRQFA